ncbi:glycosyltransferase family 4 protein [Vibrio fluvialis]|uniref:glycosyltransferase family 4 protein n=1 Tax=Vibrio fluvialis TaxID=676 RepID=UPI00096B8601|nr:glycosyltransferase family 4 protein [Vibrio fluvialis]EKO3437168.1 glycosyltransferase family 4 protein [Vibrio fluvialis]
MNILHILPSLKKGGPSLVVKELVEELSERGHDVTVGYFDSGVEIEFNSNVTTKKLDFKRGQSFLNEYDIVHTHLYRPDVYGVMNKKYIKKLVTTVHSDLYHFMSLTYGTIKGGIASIIWSLISLRFDNIFFLTVSQKNKFPIISKLVKNSVVPNGCKAIPFEGEKYNHKFGHDKIILGACAHVVKLKRFDQVLKLIANDYGDRYRFILVGDGPELGNLKDLACELGINNKVQFVGRTLDVSQYLRCFDIFMMTSESEGMPMAVLEAASAKIPIVSSNLEVIIEFLGDEVSFFELDDLNSMRNAVDYAIENKNEIRESSFVKYQNLYTHKAMADLYIKRYKELRNN